MRLRGLLWWAIYGVLAIFLQQLFVGFDAFIPGFLVLLRSKKIYQILIFFLLVILIQEGTSSLLFGMSPLWYAGQALIFFLSSRFFVSDNFFCISLLSFIFAVYRVALLFLMSSLQDVWIDYPVIIEGSIIQAILTPCLWGVTTFFWEKANSNVN